jgi:2-polyprenyl-3-methyl-5-hydroxy-6-metoxy-1,4-benzoquinol methylase
MSGRSIEGFASVAHNAKHLVRRIRTRSGVLTFSEEVDTSPNTPLPPHYLSAREFGPPVVGRRIVDVGCWTGRFIRMLALDHPAEIWGIDVDGPWLSAATESNPEATFLCIESIGHIPDSLRQAFDTVYFLETLEHLPRNLEYPAAKSLEKLLAPDGELILSVPAAGLAALLDPAWYLVGHRHYRSRRLVRIMRSAGLVVDECGYSGSAWHSLDICLFYIHKHILLREYSAPMFLANRLSTRVSHRRRMGSTGIWIRAHRAKHPEDGDASTYVDRSHGAPMSKIQSAI